MACVTPDKSSECARPTSWSGWDRFGRPRKSDDDDDEERCGPSAGPAVPMAPFYLDAATSRCLLCKAAGCDPAGCDGTGACLACGAGFLRAADRTCVPLTLPPGCLSVVPGSGRCRECAEGYGLSAGGACVK